MNKETEAIHFLKRLVYHVERSYSGTFKELHQAKEFLESLDESPAPTSIKTAEEILDKHLGLLEGKKKQYGPDAKTVIAAMQEYKNQPTGDKWAGDEDLLQFTLRVLLYASVDHPAKTIEEQLIEYKKSKQ